MSYFFGQGVDAPATSVTPATSLAGLGGGGGDDLGFKDRDKPEGGCRGECIANGHVPGTPEFTLCMQECGKGRGDIEDGDKKPVDCHQQCLDKGFQVGTQRFVNCMLECRGGSVTPECQPGERWDEATGKCVPVGGEECQGGYRLADQPIQGGAGSVWTDEIIKPEHGWMRDPNAEGHQVWNQTYGWQNLIEVHNFIQTQSDLTPNLGGGACKKGFANQVINGEDWCCPSEGDYGETTPGLGEWQWPQEMQDFWKLLLGRGTELLGMPLGITPEEQSAMFGKGFETVRGREAGEREAVGGALSRSGMLGTGAELESARKISRGIEEDISDIMRDLLIYGSERKKSDLLDYTGAAQSLFGTGMGYENLQEAINAARRGEKDRALMLLLSFFGGLQ